MLADRFRRRPLLICANLLAAALVLLILLVHGRSSMWLIFLVMFLYGVIGSVLGPAETALLPTLVPADLLAEANGARQTLIEGLRLVTPLLGAGLFTLVGGGAIGHRRGDVPRRGGVPRGAAGKRAGTGAESGHRAP